MSDTPASIRRRFDELVPWYVTGEIAPDDRAWMERYLAEHPDAGAALNWHEGLGAAVDAHYSRLPESVGWAGLAQRLDAERAAKRAQAPDTHAAAVRTAESARTAAARTTTGPGSPGLIERLSGWLGELFVRPAYALAAALIVGQTAAIGYLMSRDALERPEHSTVRGASATIVPALEVRFRQSATEQELRALLSQAGARIVDGPDQLGDYVLVPRAATLDELRDTLKQSDLVTSLRPFEWKPTTKDDAKP